MSYYAFNYLLVAEGTMCIHYGKIRSYYLQQHQCQWKKKLSGAHDGQSYIVQVFLPNVCSLIKSSSLFTRNAGDRGTFKISTQIKHEVDPKYEPFLKATYHILNKINVKQTKREIRSYYKLKATKKL